MGYDFDKQFESWARFPVDDFGYLSAQQILALHPAQLRELVEYAYNIRFDPKGWRNKDLRLWDFMGQVATLNNKTVLDYGCGMGLDSLFFALHTATVILADMHPLNLVVAQKLLTTFSGRYAPELVVTLPHEPWLIPSQKFDLFWSMGVLHHTPHLPEILQRACQCLNPGGECRIVLYSDKRWEQMMGEPPPDGDILDHPRHEEFARKCDTVGFYADWYNQEKLAKDVEGFASVMHCEYLCNDQMIGAVIRPGG